MSKKRIMEYTTIHMSKKRMIEYKPTDNVSDYLGYVMVDKITHLSKSDDGEITYIHLINGEKLESMDSAKTLNARINICDT